MPASRRRAGAEGSSVDRDAITLIVLILFALVCGIALGARL